MEQKNVHELILEIYDAALDPHILPRCLDKMTDIAQAQGSIIFDWEHEENYIDPKLIAFAHSNYYSRIGLEKYLRKCGEMEMRDQEHVRAKTGSNDTIELIDDSIFAGSREELRKMDHVRVLERIGLFHRAAGVLNKDNRWLSLITLQLEKSKPPLKLEQRQFIEPLLPHLAKSLSLMKPSRQLAEQNQGLLAAINRLTTGVCFLDRQGRIITENDEFRRQRETYRVFYRDQTGHIHFSRMADEKRFDELKEHALNHGRFGARPRKEAVSSAEDTFLCVEVIPFENCDEIGTKAIGGFIIFSADTSLPMACDTYPLKQAFGLTDTELELASAIAEGLTNVQIAERRERSNETINAQVKSILAKTQCTNRTQFVRLMMSFGMNFITPSAGAN